MTNILNHNRSIFNFIPNKNDYWDIQLHIDQESNNSDDNIDNDNTTKCLAAYINTNNDDCINNNKIMELVSDEKYKWEDAINNGFNLDNIGLTGMDCGYIKFDKDNISDEEFYKLFANSTLEIDKGDCRLHLLKINGNNKLYDYSVDITKSPTNDKEKVIKLNGGFFQGFFRIGDGCDYRVLPSYLSNEWCLQFKLYPVESFENTDETQRNSKKLNDVNENATKGCFFYIGTRAENKLYKYYNNKEKPSTLIKDLGLNQWYDEFSTNNKHITYNRTKEGFKANNPPSPENDSITIRHEHKSQKLNYFTLMNRTPSGYTAETIENLEDNKKEKKYDVLADLYENALSFQITDDGKIGYKYLVKSCENNPTYKIESEWSLKGIVEFGKWSTISVRIIPILPHKRMRLMFYVNNKLYLCSKELPLLDLRELNDIPSKQESVPFNISIGGGTQGLIDVIYDDYKNIPKETLHLAKEFGGSFIGYFKEFKFFNCSKYYHY